MHHNFKDDDIDMNDPDVTMLCSGGFAYYDSNGVVLGSMAISTQHTQYFVNFNEPETLHADDVAL
jgi:hypothetical protein